MSKVAVRQWLMLVMSLPTQRTASRMRLWRALKGMGAAVLRDGVYLLPADAASRASFEAQAREVIAAGGSAYVLSLNDVGPSQERHFIALFDRGAEYARLLDALGELKRGLSRRRGTAAQGALRRLRREYEALRAVDYFAGPAAEQAQQLLAEIEAIVAALGAPGEPVPRAGAIRRLDRKAYRGRLWATRAQPWVDRLASAWLIRRFIDPKARVVWLKDAKDCPKRALGFDFDGATFTHVGARVSFEVLTASFGLEGDSALVRIGSVVHYLDVGGAPVAEARGFEALLSGARARAKTDDALLAEASKMFDYLYQAYSQE